MDLQRQLRTFWLHHPALFHGLAFLLGTYGALDGIFLILIPCFFLWIPFLYGMIQTRGEGLQPLALNFLLTLAALTYVSLYYQSPSLPSNGISGTAHLTIDHLCQRTSPFGSCWQYHCHLKTFIPDLPTSPVPRHLKCLIMIPQKKMISRPLANQDYLVQGTLQATAHGSYMLKIRKENSWRPIKGSWNLAEKRYQAKKRVKTFIRQVISHPPSATFLAGLATGEFDDRLMQSHFARFGLQHIMAISGFHFAIIASLLSFLFRFFIPRKSSALLMVILLGLYFFFLGSSPSILRSWIMILVVMCGSLIDRKGKALNALGVALMCVLLVDPLMSQTLGFQFSFLITGAILLLFAPVDRGFELLLPKRFLSHVIEMDGWNQHGYYLLALFRQGLALTAVVTLFSLPLTLYHFHRFPLMSLLYNLFFPLLVSVSLCLLLVGLMAYGLYPPLGAAIHAFNSFYTKWVLNLTSNIPPSLDFYIELANIPIELVILHLCLMTTFSILLKARVRGAES